MEESCLVTLSGQQQRVVEENRLKQKSSREAGLKFLRLAVGYKLYVKKIQRQNLFGAFCFSEIFTSVADGVLRLGLVSERR